MKIQKALAIAGFIAIFLNTIMLKVAKICHIKAESGGLLRLVMQLVPKNIGEIPVFKTEWVWFAFHFATGWIMILTYLTILDKLRIGLWAKGALLSLFPWLINGLVVLPLIGQGLFGSGTLSTIGIIYFLMANLLFGYSMVYIFYVLRNKEK